MPIGHRTARARSGALNGLRRDATRQPNNVTWREVFRGRGKEKFRRERSSRRVQPVRGKADDFVQGAGMTPDAVRAPMPGETSHDPPKFNS